MPSLPQLECMGSGQVVVDGLIEDLGLPLAASRTGWQSRTINSAGVLVSSGEPEDQDDPNIFSLMADHYADRREVRQVMSHEVLFCDLPRRFVKRRLSRVATHEQ